MGGQEKYTDQNNLFPVFLKLEKLKILIVGGGNVGVEKLSAILNNSPETTVHIISLDFDERIESMQKEFSNISLEKKSYASDDLNGFDLIFSTVNDQEVSEQIASDANAKEILINVADKPELCDFYLSSIVSKGSLKIAISTNGKSPTIAKRLKEVIGQSLPEEMPELLDNMSILRKNLSGDFDEKVKKLNHLTRNLSGEEEIFSTTEKDDEKKELVEVLEKANRRNKYYMLMIGLLIIFTLATYAVIYFDAFPAIVKFATKDNHLFLWMLLAGFCAEIVAGSMGMGYGVICTTILLILNIPPQVISASIHSAETFTTAAGSLSHWKLKNVNKKLVLRLAIPAILGAIIGAISLTYAGENYAKFTKPFIAIYTTYLGVNILLNAFKEKKEHHRRRKPTNIPVLGLVGGFIDSFAGGGWGPLVTGTFIKNGRDPRYVVGSSTVAKFLLTITSAITFVFTIGIQHWNIVLGLLIGGVITAPISAKFTSIFPVKKMYITVGIVVVVMGIISIYKSIIG